MERLVLAPRNLLTLVLLGSLSCAAARSASFDMAVSECGVPNGQCENECERLRGVTCDALAYRKAEHVLATADSKQPVRFGDVTASEEQMRRLCESGLTRTCETAKRLEALHLKLNPSTEVSTSGGATGDGPASKVVQRAMATKEAADKALSMMGDPDVQRLADQIARCRGTDEECEKAAKSAEGHSLVGARAGMTKYIVGRFEQEAGNSSALLALEPQVAKAEKLAAEAMAEASRFVVAKENLTATLQREGTAIEALRTECKAGPQVCATKCTKGDLNACVIVAGQEQRAAHFAQARDLLKRACDGSVQTACGLLGDLAKEEKAYAERAEDLWREVESAADAIATKRHLAQLASENFHGRKNELATARMVAHAEAELKERYCPAVNQFLSHATRAEFARRAKEKCDNGPPVATGLSGTQVTLTERCRVVFATACPAPPPKPKPSTHEDFVPMCVGDRPWMFAGSRGCQCGAEVANPCASKGCRAFPLKDGACGCKCQD